MDERFYSDEQAQEILRLAARTSAGSGAISRSQLLETAAELGIQPAEVLQAEREFFEHQALESDRKAFVKQKRREFTREVTQWLSVAFLLFGIALFSSGFDIRHLLTMWPKWPVGLMSIFMVKESIEFLMDMTVNREATFEKWRQKQAKKIAKQNEAAAAATPIMQKPIADVEANALDQNQARS